MLQSQNKIFLPSCCHCWWSFWQSFTMRKNAFYSSSVMQWYSDVTFGLKARSWYIIARKKNVRKYIHFHIFTVPLQILVYLALLTAWIVWNTKPCYVCFLFYAFAKFSIHSLVSLFVSLFSLCLFYFFGGVPWLSEAVQEAEQEDVKVVVDAQAPKPTKKTKAAAASCQSSSTRKEKKGKHKG